MYMYVKKEQVCACVCVCIHMHMNACNFASKCTKAQYVCHCMYLHPGVFACRHISVHVDVHTYMCVHIIMTCNRAKRYIGS